MSVPIWPNGRRTSSPDPPIETTGIQSIEVESYSGNVRRLSLVNDEDAPGVNKVYGTDETGTLGWKDDPTTGSAIWGAITGALSNQTDLNSELALKAAKVDLPLYATSEGAVGDGVTDNTTILQNLITNNAGRRIVIGKNISEVFLIDKPLNLVANTILEINGTLKNANASIRSLTANASIGSATISVANADQYFKVDQWVAIKDDNSPTEGGGAWKTRKEGIANRIIAVTSSTVTLANNLTRAYTTAANAQIGHANSVILIDNVDDVKISGTGIIDQNRANGFNVQPIYYTNLLGEELRAQNGIAILDSDRISIQGVTINNATLHGIAAYTCTRLDIRDILINNTHDKGVLLNVVSDFILDNIDVRDSLDEDGVTLYNLVLRGFVNNIRAQNCRRYGFTALEAVKNVIINNLQLRGNRNDFYVQNSSNLQIDNVICTGINATDQSAGFAIVGSNNINGSNIIVDAKTTASRAISVATSTDVILNGGIVIDMPGREAFGTDGTNVTFKNFLVENVGTIMGVAGTNTKVVDCNLKTYTSLGSGATTTKFINCTGDFVGSNRSTTKIVSGRTYVNINHGLSITPNASNIRIIPTNNLASASHFWISNIDENIFRLNVDTDPGANATFAWEIVDSFDGTTTTEPTYIVNSQSDFSAGVDGYGVVASTISGNNDAIFGEDNVLKVYANAVNTTHGTGKAILKLGNVNRVTFKYLIPSGNTHGTSLRVYANSSTLTLYLVTPVRDTWIEYTTTEFTPTNTTLLFYLTIGGTNSYAGSDSPTDDIVYLKDILVEYR